MEQFDINDIKVAWEVDACSNGTSYVTERVTGIEKAFIYGPVPAAELEEFITERREVMATMVKRFRASKMN